MQLDVFEILQDVDYSDKRVMIGLSGGINSAAALIYLAEKVEQKPKELFLYYSHIEQHSDDTFDFVLDLVNYAKSKFKNVVFESSNHCLFKYFENGFKGIPHPSKTPCTRILKLLPMTEFMSRHDIDIDVVGYVRHEYNRIQRQIDRGVQNKEYLIRHLSDEDCFSLTEKYLGWYPEIYHLKWNDPRIWNAINQYGNELHPKQLNTIKQYARRGYNYRSKSYRVFKHNNCLPCKNMHQWEIFLIRIFYPTYYAAAMELAGKLNSHWGRSDELIEENSDCAICSV